jgi:NAD(P)-dependent dehydrogenase (short-subunit alcohol dehydrogenase family)
MLESFKINTLGNIHLFNLALPLIRKGQAKKIIAISSGMTDPDFITNFSITDGAPYTISKGALNIAIAKFDAQYRKEGILFMAISPGLVATQDTSNCKSLMSSAHLRHMLCICLSGGFFQLLDLVYMIGSITC